MINLALLRASPSRLAQRIWEYRNETDGRCELIDSHTTTDALLETIGNMTRRAMRSYSTNDPFHPDPVGLQWLIMYLAAEETQFEVVETRCLKYDEDEDVPISSWLGSHYNWFVNRYIGNLNWMEITSVVTVHTEDWYLGSCDRSFKSLNYEFYFLPYDIASWFEIGRAHV